MDDLDSLLEDLGRGSTSGTSSSRSSQASQVHDELSDLMNELDMQPNGHTQDQTSSGRSSGVGQSNRVSVPPKGIGATNPRHSVSNVDLSNSMDDLDALMDSLATDSKGRASTASRSSTASTVSAVSASGIDDLMNELAKAPPPVSSSQRSSQANKRLTTDPSSYLDDLMAEIEQQTTTSDSRASQTSNRLSINPRASFRDEPPMPAGARASTQQTYDQKSSFRDEPPMPRASTQPVESSVSVRASTQQFDQRASTQQSYEPPTRSSVQPRASTQSSYGVDVRASTQQYDQRASTQSYSESEDSLDDLMASLDQVSQKNAPSARNSVVLDASAQRNSSAPVANTSSRASTASNVSAASNNSPAVSRNTSTNNFGYNNTQSPNTSSRASTASNASAAAPPATRKPAPVAAAPRASVGDSGQQELDALMSSLAASSAPTQQRSAAPVIPNTRPTVSGQSKDELSLLLGSLNNQMSNVADGNVASKGICGYCRQPILGEVINAIGKVYHLDHFICSNCQDPIGTKNFYEVEGAINCEKCYQMLFCPRCAYCDQPVLDRCVTALGKKWHVNHFICNQCLQPFPNGVFFERDGKPFCESDFYGAFAPKCGSCDKPIRGDCVNALGQQWHLEHFVCQYCHKSFGGQPFYEYSGKPYCEQHYHQQSGAICAGCVKPITGRCVNALDKKWHPEHFTCAFCMQPLSGSNYSEKGGKPYCKECHTKLFS